MNVKLSDRQRQCLEGLTTGESIKAMGFRLQLSPKTVEYHVAALKRKLQIQDLATLTHFALAHGYIKFMFSTALTRGDTLELL